MTKVEDKFDSEILGGRVVSSTLWSIFISCTWLIAASSFLLSLQFPLQPLSNLLASLQLVLAPSSWFHIISFVGLSGWLAVFHSKNFTTTPAVVKCWAGLLLDCLRPDTFRAVWVFSFFSVLASWCVVKLASSRFSDLLVSCPTDPDSYCLSDCHLFLLEISLVTGILLGLRYQFYSASYLEFPVIYKEKWGQVKQHLKPLVFASFIESLQILKYLTPLHFVFGQFLARCVSNIVFFPSDKSLSSITSYLDLTLLFTSLVLVAFLLVVSSTVLKVFNIFASHAIDFDLPDLLDAVSSEKELLRLLSLQRLALLSAQSVQVRKEIFSLSQPGGHPHHWNTVNKACLAKVDTITTSLTNIFNPKPKPAPLPKAEQEPVVNSPYIRRLAPTTPRTKVEDLVPAPGPSPSTKLWGLVIKQVESLKSKPGISALFKMQPNAEVCAALSQSQEAIWSIDILSQLAASSITEDTFGVVQKDLPTILRSLLGLEQNLERCRGQFVRRGGAYLELRAAVRAAIYRIVVKFGDHLLAVPLAGDFSKKLKSYQQFLEA